MRPRARRYGMRHDPIAHGAEPTWVDCRTCGHSTAPLWFGQPGSGDHSEDDGSCFACGPEAGRQCAWDESDR